ncbi:MAG: hypothetical protein AAFQ41_17025 [Cyanobacteria bacterium J06623_7]
MVRILAYEIQQEDLSEVSNEYGFIQIVYIPKDRETDEARGFLRGNEIRSQRAKGH